MEALDLAGGGRGGGLGEAVHDAVVPADPIKQHLATAPEPGRELFAVVCEDFVGDPVTLQRPGEREAHGPARGPHAGVGDDAEPGVVIDPGHDLDLAAIGQEHTTHDVELPQRHRGVAFPALVVLSASSPFAGLDQAVSDQDPVHGHARGHRFHARAAKLMRQAARTPPGMLPAHLTHHRFELDRGLPRTGLGPAGPVDQTPEAVFPIAGQPLVKALAGHPHLGGHARHGLPGQHGQHRPIALLDNGQLDKHRSRPPAARRPQTTYSQQTDHGHCQPCPGTGSSTMSRDRTPLGNRTGEESLYSVKAPGWRRARSGPARSAADAAGGRASDFTSADDHARGRSLATPDEVPPHPRWKEWSPADGSRQYDLSKPALATVCTPLTWVDPPVIRDGRIP
jgi:hypothetical protein